MLLVADEATGLPDPVFTPLEGTLTGKLNILLLIYNPTKTRGFAIASQDDPRFIALRWNSEESEIVTKSQVETYAKRYGRDSNTYRIRVLGLPPLATDDVLIPPDWITSAAERILDSMDDDPIIKGIDVGGGGDPSIICTRVGGDVTKISRNHSSDTMEVTAWACNEMDRDESTVNNIDMIGIGRGVFDRARQLGYQIFPVDSRNSAIRDDRYYNRRSEMYWNLRTAFEEGTISLYNVTDCRELFDELYAIKKKEDGKNRVQIFRKEEIKKELGHSPNCSDALAMTYARPEGMFRHQRRTAIDAYREALAKQERKKGGWMGA